MHILRIISAHPGETGVQILRRCQSMAFYTYIVANRRNGAVYTGMTDNLAQRVWQHKNKVFRGFSARYGCDKLVWYEVSETRDAAYHRERDIKEWRRSWKLLLIEEANPDWTDLYETLNC